MKNILGIDTGGTFTDFVLWKDNSLHVHKVLSTPDAPEKAILLGISELGLSLSNLKIVHGSTVATNAALEGKGVKTLYIANRGFADLLTIGRQNREKLYELQPSAIKPPVPREYCVEVGGRIDANGQIIEPLNDDDIALIKHKLLETGAESVAVNLLFSYLNSDSEKQIADSIDNDTFVSLSSDVLPEIKEYERGIATWLNAWLGPLVEGYLLRLKNAASPANVAVMQSAGQTIAAEQAGKQAVRMLLSGPAGGLVAASDLANTCDIGDLLTFDMGGTSTDVALLAGQPTLSNEGRIGRYPVAIPMVDMHTIGAGGGSIAWLDNGNMLHVGPQSAGAKPGPACYGHGANTATVTDANLVLGRLQSDAFLGGGMTLDKAAANQTISLLAKQLGSSVNDIAMQIISIANEHMARALRTISLQKGKDPANYTLVSFGGAGGLHVCALAEALSMKQALVPVHGGVLSALGMLRARPGRQLSRTHIQPLDSLNEQEIGHFFDDLVKQGSDALVAEGIERAACTTVYSVDMRYIGQSFTLNVDWQNKQELEAAFHLAHQERYGHQLALAVEIVTLRVSVQGPETEATLPRIDDALVSQAESAHSVIGFEESVPLYKRETLAPNQIILGPAIIAEQVATTWLAPHWQCKVDSWGNLRLTHHQSHPET